jgi:tetratricopeptide (TPR) repeat protein
VAAFGSIFLVMGTPGYGPIRSTGTSAGSLYILFSAFFVTSSLLHYYYDGFIWKIHDRDTGRTLGLPGPGLSEMSVPALLHFGKWAGLALLVAALIGLEASTPATPERYEARLRALERLTPEIPELRRHLIIEALEEQRLPDALALAERNVDLRPRSHDARADLGRVHVQREDWQAAETAYRDALVLRPGEIIYLTDLARVTAQQGPERLADASLAFREALESLPDDEALQVELAIVEMQRGKPEAAAALLERSLAADPESQDTRGRLVESLITAGDSQRAVDVAREGVDLAPESAPAQRSLGAALHAAGLPGRAAEALARAQALDPALPGIDLDVGRAWFAARRYRQAEPHLVRADQIGAQTGGTPAGVYFMLGTIYHKTNRHAQAEIAWQRFVERAPDPATGHRTLGTRLAKLGENAAAIDAYREAARLQPDHPPTHYKLGKLLWDEGQREAGRRELETAARMGQPLPSALRTELN